MIQINCVLLQRNLTQITMKKALFTLVLAVVAMTACASGTPKAETEKPDSVLLKEWQNRIQTTFQSNMSDQRTPEAEAKAIAEVGKLIVQCCEENKDRVFPGELLKQTYYFVDKAELIRLAQANPRYFQEGPMARMRTRILAWKNQLPGAEVADLTMNDTTGTVRHLREMIVPGHYTLIDFWASWCGPCRQEMPGVKAVYEKYHAKGFDIIGVSFDNKREAWVKAINTVADGLPWQHISDLKGWECQAGEVYGVNSIPCTLLVGPDGHIVAEGLRAEALAKKMAEIYAE